MLAVDSGHLDMVQFLVDKECDIQARNAQGRTALIFAGREDHVEVVRYLLNKARMKMMGRSWTPPCPSLSTKRCPQVLCVS